MPVLVCLRGARPTHTHTHTHIALREALGNGDGDSGAGTGRLSGAVCDALNFARERVIVCLDPVCVGVGVRGEGGEWMGGYVIVWMGLCGCFASTDTTTNNLHAQTTECHPRR